MIVSITDSLDEDDDYRKEGSKGGGGGEGGGSYNIATKLFRRSNVIKARNPI